MTYTDASRFARKRRADAGTRPVEHDLMRPVAFGRFWIVSRNDLTLGRRLEQRVRSGLHGSSTHMCSVSTGVSDRLDGCVRSHFNSGALELDH
jgi:hypothetical protein